MPLSANKSPRDLVKYEDSYPLGLEWGLRFCISNKFLSDSQNYWSLVHMLNKQVSMECLKGTPKTEILISNNEIIPGSAAPDHQPNG